jgi:hypothetical protein
VENVKAECCEVFHRNTLSCPYVGRRAIEYGLGVIYRVEGKFLLSGDCGAISCPGIEPGKNRSGLGKENKLNAGNGNEDFAQG